MQILFIGQKGIPPLNRSQATSREQRVESLAKQLTISGHKVAVTCSKPFTSTKMLRYNKIELIHTFSLNPEKPGGLIHLVLNCFTIWRRQPNVVHIHSWKAASLVRLAALLSPETTFIWTIDSLPQNRFQSAKFIAWQAKNAFDAISVPTRQLQYLLLHFFNIRATYIPDGFTIPDTEDTPVSFLGLRKNQYCITTATHKEDIKFIAKAYQEAKTQKKLVVVTESTPSLKRLTKQFSFLKIINIAPGHALHSLLRQSALIIHTGLSHGPETTLQAMNAAKPIIATTNPILEETLGTSATFVRQGDSESLKNTLNDLIKTKKQDSKGKKAAKRAQNHFQWPRIIEDYLILYHYPVIRKIPIDSVVDKSFLRKSIA